MQLSIPILNLQLDSVAITIGPSPVLKIFDGVLPDECQSPDDGDELVLMSLPVTWLEDAFDGMIAKSGTWQGLATQAGTARYFRIYSLAGTCGVQGTVTAAGGGGDMTVSSPGAQIYADSAVMVIGFTLAYTP